MSDYNGLTRFVVQTNSQLRRLVSIHEETTGRLIAKTTIEGTHAVNNGNTSEIENLKHTIHLSGCSQTGANLIHGTTVFLSGEKSETHLLTHAIRDDRLQPIYARRVMDLLPDDEPKLGAQDRILNITAYDPAKSVLLYQLWVTSRRGGFRFPMSIHYGLKTALFGEFALCLAYCFVPGASDKHGNFKSYGTSSEGRLTAEELAVGHVSGISEGSAPETAKATIVTNFKEMLQPARTPFPSWKTPLVTPAARWWSGHSVPFRAAPFL